MNRTAQPVFLLDVDNTLLDNDRFAADLGARLARDFGAGGRDRYWALYAELRDQLGYADYLGTLQRFRCERPNDPALPGISSFLLEYPFIECVYPGALDAIAHLGRIGTPVVLSDGDIVFQPRKIQRSGLWAAVDGRVMITLHKERRLDEVRARHPARHYVMVDDKRRVLAAMKSAMGADLTTVFVRQGHYALDPANRAAHAAPDITIERIGDLVDLDLSALCPALAGTR
ncbi:MAG TPA: HAD family hydrolase [Rhodanobacteraceae bacterium]|nr:HAD family hydrolase [Rhodanobacteraceae bacterium]